MDPPAQIDTYFSKHGLGEAYEFTFEEFIAMTTSGAFRLPFSEEVLTEINKLVNEVLSCKMRYSSVLIQSSFSL